MLSRRSVLIAPLAGAVLAPSFAATGKMSLCMHQNTSRAAGFRKSLEGWAKAGIKNVEITDVMLEEFLKTDTLEAANKIVKDNGLKVVSSAAVITDLLIQRPTRAAALETWKKRLDQFATFGVDRSYCPAVTGPGMITEADYKSGPDCIREFGEEAKKRNMTAMIEFARNSAYIATLSTSLRLIREAAHPSVRPMLDFYHFWSGMGKMEDLDMLKPGELAHCHFQDTPDTPRELFTNQTRLIPGDGVSPLDKILKKLQEKGYAGPLSVELFLPNLVNGDPEKVAAEIKMKAEAVMKKAKVM